MNENPTKKELSSLYSVARTAELCACARSLSLRFHFGTEIGDGISKGTHFADRNLLHPISIQSIDKGSAISSERRREDRKGFSFVVTISKRMHLSSSS